LEERQSRSSVCHMKRKFIRQVAGGKVLNTAASQQLAQAGESPGRPSLTAVHSTPAKLMSFLIPTRNYSEN
jgi:hypothetical protein